MYMSRKSFYFSGSHMFGRAILHELPECIFENFEIAEKMAVFKFSKFARVIYPKNRPKQKFGY